VELTEEGAGVVFVNDPEEIIEIPEEDIPGDLPQTSGTPAERLYALGALVAVIGALLLYNQKKREEMSF